MKSYNFSHQPLRQLIKTRALPLILLLAGAAACPAQSVSGSLPSGSLSDTLDPVNNTDVDLDVDMGTTEQQQQQPEEPFVPEELFPPVDQPLQTVEDYQARLQQIKAVAREMAQKAQRVNNTAALWKEAYEQLEADTQALKTELETVKKKNRELIIENGELRDKAEKLRTVNLDNPIMSFTEEDLRQAEVEEQPLIITRNPEPDRGEQRRLDRERRRQLERQRRLLEDRNRREVQRPAAQPARVNRPPAPTTDSGGTIYYRPQSSSQTPGNTPGARGRRIPVPQSANPFPGNNAAPSDNANWAWDAETGTVRRVSN
jgi:regulator of replication initiation timing